MDKAYDKYKSYSSIEKPRISRHEVLMGKIELLMQAKRYDEALSDLNKYESQHGTIALGGEPKATFPMGGFGGGAKS